jgi:hypothetical protein
MRVSDVYSAALVGGQRGPSLCDIWMYIHYTCQCLIYIFDGAVTGSSYVTVSRCYNNTPELTNKGGYCTSMFPMPQIANVDQMQPFHCRIAHLGHGLTLTYWILLTGNGFLAALRTERRLWEGYV